MGSAWPAPGMLCLALGQAAAAPGPWGWWHQAGSGTGEELFFFPCCILAIGVAALEQNGLRGVFVVLCLPASEHREQPLQP